MKRDGRLGGGRAGGGGGSDPPNPPGNGGHDDDNNDENWNPRGWNRSRNYDHRWDDNQRTSTTKPQTLDKHKRNVPKLNLRDGWEEMPPATVHQIYE
eukprot:5504294-Amphidinium_carterae.1